jgi:hypothetical protein
VLGRAGGRRREGKKEGERKEKRGKRKKRKEEKGKGEKRKKEREEKKREMEKNREEVGKIRKNAREIRGGFCGVFSNFPGVGGIFGPAVTARRTGWRDRGGCGIPGRWPTAALGRCAVA